MGPVSVAPVVGDDGGLKLGPRSSGKWRDLALFGGGGEGRSQARVLRQEIAVLYTRPFSHLARSGNWKFLKLRIISVVGIHLYTDSGCYRYFHT